jgi:hypothetical protein
MAAAPFFVAAETRRSPAHARRREHAPLDDSLERFPESVFRRRGLAGSPQKARRLNELERVSDSEEVQTALAQRGFAMCTTG